MQFLRAAGLDVGPVRIGSVARARSECSVGMLLRMTISIFIGLLMPRRAICGTVIATNLPASTAIVNIDARADGAGAYDAGQDHWYQHFSSAGAGSLLTYTVQPGTYEFRLTKPSLATVEFPALTSRQLQQLFTAWSYNNPWVTDYMVFDVSAATNTSEAQIFAGGVVSTTYGSAEAAFDAAVASGYANKIIVGPGGRYTRTPATQYTFTVAETLVFAVPDYGLGDNAGGVSIVISPASAASYQRHERKDFLRHDRTKE